MTDSGQRVPWTSTWDSGRLPRPRVFSRVRCSRRRDRLRAAGPVDLYLGLGPSSSAESFLGYGVPVTPVTATGTTYPRKTLGRGRRPESQGEVHEARCPESVTATGTHRTREKLLAEEGGPSPKERFTGPAAQSRSRRRGHTVPVDFSRGLGRRSFSPARLPSPNMCEQHFYIIILIFKNNNMV